MQIYTDANGVQQFTDGRIVVDSDTGEAVLPVLWDFDVHGGEVDPAKVGGYTDSSLTYSQAAFDANESLKATVAANEVTAALAALKAIADSTVDAIDQQGLLTRSLAVVVLDTINTIHATWTDFKAETAAATSLANFQSRVAANTPNLPQRTKAQLLAAIKTEIAAD